LFHYELYFLSGKFSYAETYYWGDIFVNHIGEFLCQIILCFLQKNFVTGDVLSLFHCALFHLAGMLTYFQYQQELNH